MQIIHKLNSVGLLTKLGADINEIYAELIKLREEIYQSGIITHDGPDIVYNV